MGNEQGLESATSQVVQLYLAKDFQLDMLHSGVEDTEEMEEPKNDNGRLQRSLWGGHLEDRAGMEAKDKGATRWLEKPLLPSTM